MTMHLKNLTLSQLTILSIACLYAGTVYSQNTQPSREILASEIKRNVMILDSEKQYASGVKIEDVKLFEDGIEQKITYFVEKKPKLNLGIVLDNSGSLRYRMGDIVWAARAAIMNLSDQDEAFVIRFVDRENIEILQDWTSDKKRLMKGLKHLYPQGGRTALFDALYLSAQKISERALENKDERYALILVSDVEERYSWYKYSDVIKMLDKIDVPIFILSYAEEGAKNVEKARLLGESLAVDTGGASYILPKNRKKDHLKSYMEQIIRDIRSNYVIGYRPKRAKKNGVIRKLKFEVVESNSGGKREALYQEEFILPKRKREIRIEL